MLKDKIYIGLIYGMLAPFLVILLIYLTRFNHYSFNEFIQQAFELKVHFKIISLGVFFADLGVFYLFLHLNKYKAVKGVIGAVIVIFFIMLLIKI